MANSNIYTRLVFFLTIVIVSGYILHPFFSFFVWSIVLAIALWPLYQKWEKMLHEFRAVAAFSFTVFVGFVVILPLVWLIYIIGEEITSAIQYIQKAQNKQLPAPGGLANLPYIGAHIEHLWEKYVLNSDQFKSMIQHVLMPYGQASKILSYAINYSMNFFFTLLCMFFCFYQGKDVIDRTINILIYYIPNFSNYSDKAIHVIRGVINSLLYLGVGIGVLMGIMYYILDVPFPVFFGFISALATLIPFALPLVFIIIFLICIAQNAFWSGIIIVVTGMILDMIMENWLRALLIGKSVQLHFLACLFGILGGIHAFGIVGIFLGPIFISLLIMLWQESDAQHRSKSTH